MRIKLIKHGSMGFRLTLLTKKNLRTLWVRWPSLTRLRRLP